MKEKKIKKKFAELKKKNDKLNLNRILLSKLINLIENKQKKDNKSNNSVVENSKIKQIEDKSNNSVVENSKIEQIEDNKK